MLKVLQLTDSDVFAGTERHVADLAGALAAEGVGVHVGCPSPSPLAERASAAGVEVLPIAKRGAWDRAAIAAVAAFLASRPGQIVHCHNGRTALIAAIAKGRAGGGRVVLTQHFLTPNYATQRGWRRLISDRVHRFVDRRTDHVIAISDAVRQGVLDRGEADDSSVTRVHNGAVCDAVPDAQADVRAALGVTPDTPLVVCAARLQPEKRVGVLVEAMAEVIRRRPDARCVIAGDGREMHALRGRIDVLGLGQAVELLGFRDDVARWMAAADVFVLPAEAEPFGLVVLEAMAAGTPVIATDAGGPREIVVPGETGWLVRPNDPADLAQAIVEALNDPHRARRLGAAGRERLLEYFTAERMARETIAVYRRVLGQSDPAFAVSAK